LVDVFDLVSEEHQLVDDCANVFSVSVRHRCEEGGKALHILRHKPSAPIEVIESLAEVEVVEEQHSCTYGTLKEVVHGIGV